MIGVLSHAGPMPRGGRDPGEPPRGPVASDRFAQLLGAGDTAREVEGAAPADATALVPSVPHPAQSQGAPTRPIGPVAPDASIVAPRQDGTTDPSPQAPAPLARVFNQDGFFGHPVTTPIQAVTAVEGDVPSAQAPVAAPADRASAEEPEAGSPTRSGADGARLLASKNAPVARSVRAVAPGASRGAAIAAVPAPPDRAQTAEPLAPPQRRAYRAPPAARSAVHVALSEIDNGLQVAARIENLDEAERQQLRDEIVAMLGRHGLSAARVQIHGLLPREKQR
ncbi:hypothetical protein ACG3SL_12895 [Sphingomonas sp. CJ20]